MARAAWPRVLAYCASRSALVGWVAVSACAEAPHGPLAGASDAWQTARESDEPAAAAKPAPVWDGYAEAQRWPAVSAVPFTSHGHQPEQSVVVRANDVARPSYAGLVTDTVFPDGSVLAELSQGTGHGYAMRKTGGAWSYFELDPKGGVLAGGTPTLCVGCHAQAPADHVFGLPRVP